MERLAAVKLVWTNEHTRRNTPESVSRKVLPENGSPNPNVGGPIPQPGIPAQGLKKKGQRNCTPAFISHCVLTVDTM